MLHINNLAKMDIPKHDTTIVAIVNSFLVKLHSLFCELLYVQ